MRSRAPIFKEPKAISLRGFSRHGGVAEYLVFGHRAIERDGSSVERLPSHQARLLRDLADPLDEEALADMLSYWRFDLDRLRERPRNDSSGGPGKPRIDLDVEITIRGNLKVEWFPSRVPGGPPGAPTRKTDFLEFDRWETRHPGYQTRPTNELLFLHGVEQALHTLRDRELRGFQPLDHVLLAGAAAAVDLLKERLEPHFDVTMARDVFVTWQEGDPDPPEDWFPSWRISTWEIDLPLRRQKAAELEELGALAERHGFSEAALFEAVEYEETRPRKSGPGPSPYTLAERVGKVLRDRGHKATKRSVERAFYLLRTHRASREAWPAGYGATD